MVVTAGFTIALLGIWQFWTRSITKRTAKEISLTKEATEVTSKIEYSRRKHRTVVQPNISELPLHQEQPSAMGNCSISAMNERQNFRPANCLSNSRVTMGSHGFGQSFNADPSVSDRLYWSASEGLGTQSYTRTGKACARCAVPVA